MTRLRSPTKQPHSDYIEKMAKHLTVVNLIERLRLGDVDQKEKKEISEKILAMSLKVIRLKNWFSNLDISLSCFF